jgi:hypothetical protein
MTEAPNILLCLLLLMLPDPISFQETYVLIEILLFGLGVRWVLGGMHHMNTVRGPRPPSLRQALRRQHHLRPKFQYRYH